MIKAAAKDIKLMHRILDIAKESSVGHTNKNKYTAFYLAVTENPNRVLELYEDYGYKEIQPASFNTYSSDFWRNDVWPRAIHDRIIQELLMSHISGEHPSDLRAENAQNLTDNDTIFDINSFVESLFYILKEELITDDDIAYNDTLKLLKNININSSTLIDLRIKEFLYKYNVQL